MPRKLTYEEVKNYIEQNGYKLISKHFINYNNPLKIKCPQGHIFWMSYDNFKKRKFIKCSTCSKGQTYNQISFNDVKKLIEYDNNYILCTKKQKIRTFDKLKIKCPQGHTFWSTYNIFKKGSRCPYCYGNSKLTYDYIEGFIKEKGYNLLSNNYVNTHTKLKLECPWGHIFYVTFNHFKYGNRCPKCSSYNQGKYHKLTYDYVESFIKEKGYNLLSNNYVNTHTKLKLECPQRHIFYVTFNHFKYGNRCPFCTISKYEREIYNILKKYNINFEFHKCIIIGKQKFYFDFFIPKILTFIEVDGEQHFKPVDFSKGKWNENEIIENYKNIQNKDKIKNEWCEENGFDILRIPYYNFFEFENILNQIF